MSILARDNLHTTTDFPLLSDPPRKEEYRPAPGPDTSLLEGQEMEGLEAEEEEQEFEFAEDLVRYIDREWKGWFCVGVAGEYRRISAPGYTLMSLFCVN